MPGPDVELSEPSDVSSDALSAYSSEDEETRHRAAAHVNIMDLPRIDNKATRGEREAPDLAPVRAELPFPAEVDALNEAQLAQLVQWAQDVGAQLKAALAELEQDHAAEWLAKEQALDRLLEASVHDRSPPV